MWSNPVYGHRFYLPDIGQKASLIMVLAFSIQVVKDEQHCLFECRHDTIHQGTTSPTVTTATHQSGNNTQHPMETQMPDSCRQ